MKAQRAMEMLGFAGTQQRYHDIDSIADLEDLSDPTTLEDETHTQLRERARQNKLQTAVLGLLVVVLGGLGTALAYRYIPLVVTNTYVQAGAVALVTYLAGRRGGMQSYRRSVSQKDEMNFLIGDHVFNAKGVIREGGQKRPPLAIPIKGYRKPGVRPQPYTVGEVDPQALERAPGSVDPDMPVAIEMHRIYSEVTDTDTGKRAVQLTDGFEPAEARVEDGVVVLLKATAPDIATEADIRKINEDYKQMLNEKKENERQIEEKEATIRKLRKEKNRPVDERVDEQLDRTERMVRAVRGGPRQHTTMSTRGRQRNGHDAKREQTEDEVTTDA